MTSELPLILQVSAMLVPLIFAITLHECAHGYTAFSLGDNTAKYLGRITLNPIKHMDLIGTLLLPLTLFAVSTLTLSQGFLFGYAKPIPVDSNQLKRPKYDMGLVAAAGPMANLIMGIAFAGCLKILLTQNVINEHSLLSLFLLHTCLYGLQINLILMALNLLPVPPLDGSRILSAILPTKIAYYFSKIEPYGFFILICLLAAGILTKILHPIYSNSLYLIGTLLDLPF